ncbi:MAG TPA: FAD-binding oxidoreductase [Anaerolineae bacterium]|nr:FAD-binding oxidoreductase [Anaerolineae bacterium]
MKRWNGWGKDDYLYPMPSSAEIYLKNVVGEGQRIRDANISKILKNVPTYRISDNHLISSQPEQRLRHARGQSLPDWVSLRYGTVSLFPDGVSFPENEDEIREIIRYAKYNNYHLIPYGGGSSVVGHINIVNNDKPTITVDMGKMNSLIDLDEISHIATFGAGIVGPDIESLLSNHGLRLGHYPQSHEFSSLGGWIASRSVGTQCYYYGRIKDLFLGGRVITPSGILDLPVFPASAAGPDIRHLILGSEGRLGFITSASVRVFPLPEHESFHAIYFPHWDAAYQALKEIVQSRINVSMLRLLDSLETESSMQLAGKEKLMSIADKALRFIGIGSERCMIIFGLTGSKRGTQLAYRQIKSIAHKFHGFIDKIFTGKLWHKSRFTTPYLRNTLWDYGYALDTLETAFPWSKVAVMLKEIENALESGLHEENEKTLVFGHLSHMYTDGASLYITYLFRRTKDPERTLERWRKLKSTASEIIIKNGGTISHQHGIGTDHAKYLEAEIGKLGIKLIKSAIKALDPKQIMNPYKLIGDF